MNNTSDDAAEVSSSVDETIPSLSDLYRIKSPRVDDTSASFDSLIFKLSLYAIHHGFSFKRPVSNSSKVKLVCACNECSWTLNARKRTSGNDWIITSISFNHHTSECLGCIENKLVTADFVASISTVKDMFDCKDYSLGQIKSYAQKLTRSTFSKNFIYAVETIVLKNRGGSHEHSFASIPTYLHQLKIQSSLNVAEFETDDGRLHSACVIYQRSINAFMFCQPIVTLDATFLTGPYGGVLLVAVAQDAQKQLLHLGFMFALGESLSSWSSFLRSLKSSFVRNSILFSKVSFFSDRDKGLGAAVAVVFPNCYHFHCVVHLVRNIKAKFLIDERVVALIFKLAKAYTNVQFIQLQQQIIDLCVNGRQVIDYLMNADTTTWARSQAPCPRYGYITSNDCESFNSTISNLKDSPLIEIFECIRQQQITWFTARQELGQKMFTHLVPMQETKFKEKLERARTLKCKRVEGASNWEVHSERLFEQVDTTAATCTYGHPQEHLYPCDHLLAVYLNQQINARLMYSDVYSTLNYNRTYQEYFPSIPDAHHWVEVTDKPNPPLKKTERGRPKTKRTQSRGEDDRKRSNRVMTCSVCSQIGHNRRCCPLLNE
ncbi:hypothetical protein RCL1_001194 [Eukaryota sp. TZLM3-RCL]